MKTFWDYLMITVGAVLVAGGFNLFLIPHQLLSGGVAGVAMIIGYFTPANIGLLYLLLNIPILIWGWVIIGRRFVLLSVINVIITSWLMQLIPAYNITIDPLLGAVFGGVIVGIGTGISLRAGGSTGGFDIIGSILTRNKDFPLGSILFLLNGFVIVILGYAKDNWDLALYSMLSIYITGKVVDAIHIRHIKVTAFIITNETEKLLEKLLQIPRGVTVIKTKGAFSHKEKDMLMTVTTRYELAELRKVIRTIDPKAFVNIVETVDVLGEFRRLK
jgi:uncharacterized membrane-anchored protein YitT (DUF2179 family)